MRDIYNDQYNLIYQHKPTLYSHIIVPIWGVVSVILTYFSIIRGTIPDWNAGHYFMAALSLFVLLLNYVYFFIVSRNVGYVIAYELLKKPEAQSEKRLLRKPFPRSWHPKVALIYCTYNDFIPYALLQCMGQSYPVDIKIFDDSTKPKYKREVDRFQSLYPNRVQVIRRDKSILTQNKAGNLNHGLTMIERQHYDFYTFLDSDEMLEPRFVEKMLKIFYYSNRAGYHVGLVQATHHSGRNITKFMHEGSLSAKFFWNAQNLVRSAEAGIRNNSRYGIQYLTKGDTLCCNLGHGCMASTKAVYQSGLFPLLVSEDVAFTMSLISNGWNIYFATQIYGNEETVTDINAMKIRCTKFTSGDLQWLKYYWYMLWHSPMLSFWQRIDAIMLMGTTDINAFLYISVPICSVLFPIFYSSIGTTVILAIPVILCLYSSTIIDICFSFGYGLSLWEIIKRELSVIIIYSSTYYLEVRTLFEDLLLHHKAQFRVTPKYLSKFSLLAAFRDNLGSILFSIITITYVMYFDYFPYMVWLAYLPPIFTPLVAWEDVKQSKRDKYLEDLFKLHNQEALTTPFSGLMDSYWSDWKL